ncbi:KxYKxGKxW signal peptide domain-containing protein [Fructilactobacillus ixorae]|uniref:KxYKxGKxW signal peptide domain-containing protein n=1 Tax=Fructilactobacillus ixorae TaxID=1750535 RepID=A0ABY5C6H4_9LACO|nr:KxYKxGKxW signal peptide domain-containing protein [Fructilactobacillus ixorae]USS93198.1 KxYKxGKxW signal peptide domain-containing protein [Fructilactobacillus ixorae]
MDDRSNHKQNLTRLVHENGKIHYKMYKDGKKWVFAGITLMGGILGANVGVSAAHADTTTGAGNNPSKEAKKDVLAGNDSATIPSTSTSNSGVSSNQDSQAKLDQVSTSMSEALQLSTSNSQSLSISNSTSLKLSISASTSLSMSTSTKADQEAGTDQQVHQTDLDQAKQPATDQSVVRPEQLENQHGGQGTANQSSSQANQTEEQSGAPVAKLQTMVAGVATADNNKVAQQQPANSAINEQTAYNDIKQKAPQDAVVSINAHDGVANIGLPTNVTPSAAVLAGITEAGKKNNLKTNFVHLNADGSQRDTLHVASDPDRNRQSFEDQVKNGDSAKTPTSVTVLTPDQVTNNERYKQAAIANNAYAKVESYSQLKAAWENNSIRYIDIANDIQFKNGEQQIKTRNTGNSVIINGNNHIVDLGNNNFAFKNNSDNPTEITISNITFKQGYTSNKNISSSLVYAAQGKFVTANFNNVTVQPSTAGNTKGNVQNPIRIFYGIGSKLTFSGNNVFELSNEIARGMGRVEIANNAHVTLNRTANDSEFSEFNFNVYEKDGNAGEGNLFIMGDNSSNTVNSYDNKAEDFPAIYHKLGGMRVGDNVTWSQSGFRYFLNGDQGNAGRDHKNAEFIFGQNFHIKADAANRRGAIKLIGNQKAIFNAGTVMDIQQQDKRPVVDLRNNSSVEFISPKSLHLAIQDDDGRPNAARKGIISGTGTFTMDNSGIKTWINRDSPENVPDGNDSTKFVKLVVKNGEATVTDLDGQVADSTILTNNTRELQTEALSAGKIKIE